MRYFKVFLFLGLTLILAGCLRSYSDNVSQVGMYQFQGTSYRVGKLSYTESGKPGFVLALFRNNGSAMKPLNAIASCEGFSTISECEKAFGAQLSAMMESSSGY